MESIMNEVEKVVNVDNQVADDLDFDELENLKSKANNEVMLEDNPLKIALKVFEEYVKASSVFASIKGDGRIHLPELVVSPNEGLFKINTDDHTLSIYSNIDTSLVSMNEVLENLERVLHIFSFSYESDDRTLIGDVSIDELTYNVLSKNIEEGTFNYIEEIGKPMKF